MYLNKKNQAKNRGRYSLSELIYNYLFVHLVHLFILFIFLHCMSYTTDRYIYIYNITPTYKKDEQDEQANKR